ncbi:Histone-lysine N-methyltransferase, H3 lysine-9 specific suvh4 [Orobanche gracilis]
MVALHSIDEQKPEIQMDTHAGYPMRRTSARIKKLEAKNSTPTENGRAPATVDRKRNIEKLPQSTKPAPKMEKKRKMEKPQSTEPAADAVATTSTAAGKSVYTLVTETLRAFNKHYLHFIQEESDRSAKQKADRERIMKNASTSKKKETTEEHPKNPAKRPDLKAITEMMNTGAILYPEKRFGSIPGIDVGHQFFSRAEMVVVGFHQHWLNGIDYIGESARVGSTSRKALHGDLKQYKLPLTISIVMSGQYEDDLDNCENIIYTGQGGNNLLGNKRQYRDQVLERGNLGLQNCMEQSVPVRVVRGHKCDNSYVRKVYTYDGLYMVVKYWAEKGVSGFTVYKFQLKRLEGQPPLTTKEVYFSRGRIPHSLSEIRGLVCEDITGGLENIPIPVTNLVDDPPISPLGFVYIKDMKYSKNINVPTIAPIGCDCQGSCEDSRRCACAKLNGGDFPYVKHKKESKKDSVARLVEPKAVVFECGPNCRCGPECVNRTSENGYRFRLEIFRTPKKGWGVRSWDYIPAGAPICEYIGLLRRTADLNPDADNSYVFDIDCLQTMKGLDGRESRLRDVSLPSYLQKMGEEVSESVPFCIDAGETGNVARFINHSCQPNLFVQCMLSSHHDIKQAGILLVAADNIPPLKELTYDYGYALDSVLGPDGKIQQMACYCGAEECRKRLF